MYWKHFPHGYPGIEEESERHLLRGTVTNANPTSAKVLTKAGFRRVGEVEREDTKDGGMITLNVFEVQRPGREEKSS